jgi:hypothetical protein
MRQPRNFDAALRALTERARTLKARKITQLGEVVIAAGAGELEPEIIAGMLLACLDGMTPAQRDDLRARGAALFRERRRPRRAASAASKDAGRGDEDHRPGSPG